MDFCVASFGVVGHHVTEPVYEFMDIERDWFDVAVLGSLVTLLSDHNARLVMKHFFGKLKNGGIGVITAHGTRSRELLGGSDCYQVGEGAREHLLRAYDAGEFGFVNYLPGHSLEAKTVDYIGASYGISMVPVSWVVDICRELDLKIIDHLAGGWDTHQDVYWIQK